MTSDNQEKLNYIWKNEQNSLVFSLLYRLIVCIPTQNDQTFSSNIDKEPTAFSELAYKETFLSH